MKHHSTNNDSVKSLQLQSDRSISKSAGRLAHRFVLDNNGSEQNEKSFAHRLQEDHAENLAAVSEYRIHQEAMNLANLRAKDDQNTD